MEHADASTPESGKNKEAIQNKAKPWLAISWLQIHWQLVILGFLLIGGSIVGWYAYLQLTKETLYIALSGPMSGEYASNGETMKRAAELRISEINQNGGIDGKQVDLLIFDDQNRYCR